MAIKSLNDCVRKFLFCSVFCLTQCVSADIKNVFTAAVYEHNLYLPPVTPLPLPRERALEIMMTNVHVYQEQTKIAALKGANIIVFPEDGVYGMVLRTRALLFPFMEYIPEPELGWNPCQHPDLYPETEIQFALSCMARYNNIYVVANIGDKQPCNVSIDPSCPHTGYYQYNTDVAYDTRGTLVAKYHKYNLFYEFQFDKPSKPDISVFSTPFGRFGLFTCFDILFEHPPIDLICSHNISNIAFPTAWMDAGPFFTSVQFHSAFALGLGINFLAANIHHPSRRFHGSGIYTPQGAAGYYYNTSNDSGGQLIVREIPVVDQPRLKACRGLNSSQPFLTDHIHTTDEAVQHDDEKLQQRSITDADSETESLYYDKASINDAIDGVNTIPEEKGIRPYQHKAEIHLNAGVASDASPLKINFTQTHTAADNYESTDAAEKANSSETEAQFVDLDSTTDSVRFPNNTNSVISLNGTDILLRHELHNDMFQYDLFYDRFNLVPLRLEGSKTSVCHTDLCCHISYSLGRIHGPGVENQTQTSNEFQTACKHSTYHFNTTEDSEEVDVAISNSVNKREAYEDEFYALGAFDGLHVYEGRYYIQVCTVIRCRK
ncbi:pantetheinase-like [Dreissena polymorpha]|uniref:CN hydrolase domain-containing protein n=1 Tax=Dreissena polymorpha TaxID=45954 RepID=A0A9D4RNF7_DREPO|nr:pantetheinase-like [Dreissena polymorpha]KAH3874949.1 hypothetical protein DPMN_038206 [Dreissena polymorpha]